MNTRFDPELSRLAFEDRLIEFCEDPRIPLLERVRMLGIIAGRLDVFFMTRVGRLKRMVAGEEARSKNAELTYAEQLEAVAAEADRITRRTYGLLQDQLLPALEGLGVRIERWDSLEAADRDVVQRTLRPRLETLIHPLAVEASKGFPHVRNLRPALVATARSSGAPNSFVVAELPADLPRLVALGQGHRFVPLEQIVASELRLLCPGIELGKAYLFRVTRNADTDYVAAHDVLGSVEHEVVRRPFQEVVRLEVEQEMPAQLRDHLLQAFECETETPEANLSERDVYPVPGLVDLTALEELAQLDLPALKGSSIARRPGRADSALLEAGPTAEMLLHFPYDDYEATLEHVLDEAARHPDLESIQTTIYRTDRNSGVVAALRAARARGAEAGAIVELKASFDERDNIELARSLEADGVHVVLSPPTLKVHAKIAVVTLQRDGVRRHVALIGTGNMNAVTARSYIDLWLMTNRAGCAREIAHLFDILNGRTKEASFECLLVAPFDMRPRFLELIEREASNALAGKPSGIRAMVNGLTDPPIISALYRASQAGVPVDLMVRGVCLLRPGQPDVSENIRVVSVAGHLLQHARIFHFRSAGSDAYFIGSADWRPRNLDDRIEVVARVQHHDHAATLDRVLTETLATRDAWELGPNGVYSRRTTTGRPMSSQGSQTYVTLTPS